MRLGYIICDVSYATNKLEPNKCLCLDESVDAHTNGYLQHLSPHLLPCCKFELRSVLLQIDQFLIDNIK